MSALPQGRSLLEGLQQLLSSSSTQELAERSLALRDGCGEESLRKQLSQVAEARTLTRGLYYVNRLIKGLSQVKTGKLNDINLNRWQEYGDIHCDSLWIIPRRDRSGSHSADYWGNYVPQIPHQMMRRYTRAGEWVLDPFLGSGTTLLECRKLGRNALGVELQPTVAERTAALVEDEPNPHQVTTRVACGDSSQADFSELLQGRTVQLALLHPPYHDIIRFSDDPRCLSNQGDVAGFLSGLRRVAEGVHRVLDKKRVLALVIGDKYHAGEWIPLGFQSMQEVLSVGFNLKSIIVKNFDATAGKRAQTELWRYRALSGGFYLFKHEYVFVFQRK